MDIAHLYFITVATHLLCGLLKTSVPTLLRLWHPSSHWYICKSKCYSFVKHLWSSEGCVPHLVLFLTNCLPHVSTAGTCCPWRHCPWRCSRNVWMWHWGTWSVGMMGMGWWLDWMILEVFSNLNDSMILQHLLSLSFVFCVFFSPFLFPEMFYWVSIPSLYTLFKYANHLCISALSPALPR